MKETSFVNRYMEVIPNRANPYSDWGTGECWQTLTVTKTNGEGFLYTTLKDHLFMKICFKNQVTNYLHKANFQLLKVNLKTMVLD